MILQVEKDTGARVGDPAHERRPFAGKQAVADFESAGESLQYADQLHRALAAFDVERD